MFTARIALLALIAFPFNAANVFAADDRSKGVPLDDATNLTGVWSFVRMEKFGEESPLEKFQELRLVIDVDSVSVVLKDTNQPAPRSVQGITFKIDAKHDPKWIDFEKPGDDTGENTQKGIFLLAGDKLIICGDDKGKERPTSFSVKDKPDYSLMELKRESRVVPPKK